MFDRAFKRAFFDKLDDMTDEQLEEVTQRVERLRLTFVRGTEADLDAGFVLKHLRRKQLERALKPSKAPKGS